MGSLHDFGAYLFFVRDIFSQWRKSQVDGSLILDQVWKVFSQSLLTTSFSGFFVGAIMTIQFSMQLSIFGALAYLGGLSTSGTVREVGPLLIAFMLSGKVGAFTSAELSTMKITEQMDAIRCLGANPMQEIILPRFLGIIIASFFLLVYGVLFAVVGGMLMSMLFVGVSMQEYLMNIPEILTGASILSGIIKAFSFSFVIASLCTYWGYITTGGAKQVGRAVVKTSVSCMLGIVIMDWFTTFIFEFFQG